MILEKKEAASANRSRHRAALPLPLEHLVLAHPNSRVGCHFLLSSLAQAKYKPKRGAPGRDGRGRGRQRGALDVLML